MGSEQVVHFVNPKNQRSLMRAPAEAVATEADGVVVRDGTPLSDALEALVNRALDRNAGNQAAAARDLAVPVRTFYRWMREGTPNWSPRDDADQRRAERGQE